jgi:seryl-tRNA synthetase
MKPSVQKIITKLAKEQENNLEKIELGITQDIQLDIKSVYTSLNSIRSVMIDAEKMLGKNARAIKLIQKAIDRVEKVGTEIGADEVVNVVKKQRAETQELESNISKAIVGIGNAMQNIV